MTKAYIFDLDGVIVDTAKFHYLAWRELAKELSFDFSEEDNERLKGVSRMKSLEIVLEVGDITGLSDEKKQELAEKKNNRYLEFIEKIDSSEILPGIRELLDFLRENGAKTALGSASKSGGLILSKLGLSEKFDIIVDGNIVENAKPDPEVFIKAANLLGIDNKDCTVVEDAAAGIEAAVAAGMNTIGVGRESVLKGADIVVDSTARLTEVIR